MAFILLIPVFLSSLLIAAHCLRWGIMPLVIGCVLFPFFLFVRKRWAVRLVQLCLIIAAVEWIRTLFVIASQRIDAEAPWLRMAIIIGSVAILTAGSACVFYIKPLKDRFK